ncbi:hypothetical protein A4X09_0g7347 [Tilletia walkeri]|uniref:Uncharacterized protein n=1 Tax=Tilletia walkeri TaxID=117179 RepID=A0A8X7T1F2_9BASI|nr:hypothetical protein A4X09_0g7347 [Tilletia walkeri]
MASINEPTPTLHPLSEAPSNVRRRELRQERGAAERHQERIAARRKQDKVNRLLASEAQLDHLAHRHIDQQRAMRAIVSGLMTQQDTSKLDVVRTMVKQVTLARHRFEELRVDDHLIADAVDRIVLPSNFEAIADLLLRPLQFSPAEWESAFQQDGPGFLYLRSDQAPLFDTLPRYKEQYPADAWWAKAVEDQAAHEGSPQSLHIKYVGQQLSSEDVASRLVEDEIEASPARRNNWSRVQQQAPVNTPQQQTPLSTSRSISGLFTIWALRNVKPPATTPLDFRASEVSQEMERVWVAVAGLCALNSAPGGFHYPWDFGIYDGISERFIQAIRSRTGTALTHITNQDVLAKLRAEAHSFLVQLKEQPFRTVGQLISGNPLLEYMRISFSAPTQPASVVILKDVPREVLTASDERVTLFGQASGPGPALERHLWSAIDRVGQTQAAPPPFKLRFFWDFWWATLVHFLVSFHAAFLLRLMEIATPAVIRVESSKMANLFASGQIFDPTKLEDVDWEDLPMTGWLKHICGIYLYRLDNDKTDFTGVVILSLHPGAIKYDPLLARHKSRLLHLSMLLQRGAEILASAGCSPAAIREALVAQEEVQDEITRVKEQLREISDPIWDLRNRNPTSGSFTTGEEASAQASHRVQAAHIRHIKAAGQPWSEEREAQWQQYAKNAPEPGPHSRWTITAATSALPCPSSIRPFSEAHQNWMMSRKEGIDLVLAAGAHDADRQDPDKAQEDFDLDDYIKKRRMARAAVAIERKTVLSAVPYDNALKQLAAHDFADPIFSASCSRCGEGFLANKSTQHRCGPEDSATPIAQHQSVTRRMILTTTELMDLFGEPSLDEDWAEPYRLLSISDVLETSALWSAFADYAFKRWPGPLVALHGTVSSDSAPFLFAPKEQSTPAALEYEALLWAVTTLLEDVHGHEALESPRRLQPQKRTTLVAAMQHDHVDAVIRVRCGENELCDYDDFVSRVNSKGGPRQLQHRHTPPVEASAKGKDPVRQLQPKVERCIKTLFDLPVWMVRDLLLQEAVSRPAPQGQSILFYGISSERLAFIGVRPLQQAGTTTSTVSQPRKRGSTTNIVDSALARAFNQHGLVPFADLRRLQLLFDVDRPQLTQYIRNHRDRLLKLQKDLLDQAAKSQT